jgi:cation diffusion facilitator CzcD-associated flavoprotein CzcO
VSTTDESGQSFGHTIIMGAGMGSIAIATELLRRGNANFTILEKEDEIGGVWRDNTYPNAACDVPAHLYSFSFALSPEWSSNYAPQCEILEYAKAVVKNNGLQEKILFGREVSTAVWNQSRSEWVVSTTSGESFVGKYLVSALGTINRPFIPPLAGLSKFTGKIMHTAEWNHDVDVRGKKVAVVGAGASAVQVVPYVVEHASRTVCLVRTPPYVMPKVEETYDEARKEGFRTRPDLLAELRQKEYDRWNYSAHAQAIMDEEFLCATENAWREHMEAAVHDGEMRRTLTPNYRFGCRRPVISNDFYPALIDPRTTVVGCGATRLTPSGLVVEDGREYEVDVVVLATGFRATDMLGQVRIHGRENHALSEEWAEGPTAYCGTLVKGFPNLFLMTGPNTQVSGSKIGIMEAQARYIGKCLDEVERRRAQTVEVSAQAHERFNEELDLRMRASVFARGGCHSWFKMGGSGKVVIKWPGSLKDFEELLEAPHLRDLVMW